MPATLESLLGDSAIADELLKALASSSAAGTDVSPLIKEDLEVEAHTQLYYETDPTELVLLKHIPRQPATSVLHQFDKIVSYGGQGHDGFYAENTLPTEADMESVRASVMIKLMGQISTVFALASFQTPIAALGETDLVLENMASTRLALLQKMCTAIYRSNDSVSRNTLRFAGLYQQILEGTSVSTSAPYTPNTDFIIDKRGFALTPDDIRAAARRVVEHHGRIRHIYMAPLVVEMLEKSLDPAERLQLPRTRDERVLLGQSVGGMNTASGACYFEPDNSLTPSIYYEPPPSKSPVNAPSPLGAGNVAAPTAANNALSQWTATDANAAVTYAVTAVNGYGESTPYSPAAVAVVAGNSVTIAITPRAADDSYKIYRGSSVLGAPRHFIAEVKGTGNTTPFNFVDHNATIPNTSVVFALNMESNNSAALVANNTARIQLANPAHARNTVSLVTLGPWMGVFELAHILHTASRDLVFSALAPRISHPYQNAVFINVGQLTPAA